MGGLNASQVEAVQAALGRTLTLWQGPPGTGKTRTLLRCALPAVTKQAKLRTPQLWLLALLLSVLSDDRVKAALAGLALA